MASKRGKRSGTKTVSKQRGKTAPAKPAARRATAPVVVAARREAAPPSLLEQAMALRDAIQRSKLTARDPWSYTAKARGWLARAEQLLDRIGASAEAAAPRKGVETLRAEVEGDRDFQEARRLF